MPFPISGTQGPKAAEKSKAKGAAGAVGGPSFASMLAGALSESPAETPAASSMGAAVATGLPVLHEEDIPTDTRGQASALMATLKELAGEALAGQPARGAAHLARLAEALGADEAQLTPQQKQVLNEARTRAAVEAEKQKS